MTLPTFIVIGPGKTGTTWLYQCLAAHPEIRLARHTKETVFFNEYYGRGLSWYQRFFEGCEGARAIGEVSNNYFHSSEAPARIAADIPNVKLISILRNPTDRLLSAYNFFQRWRSSSDQSLEKTIADRTGMISNNFYDIFLERWLTFFKRDRLLVVLYDDIKSDPHRLLRQIYEFIGVNPDFVPPMTNERVRPASNPRLPALFSFLKLFAKWLRRWNFHRLLTWAKLNPVVLGILTSKNSVGEQRKIAPDTYKKLISIYRPHIDKLELLISRDLSSWK